MWSPEDPFLYELEVATAGDALPARFGMRSFRLDPKTGRAVLNGKPYYLRGTNVCIFRFFEDAQRGDKPWRAEWVRRLHEQFRSMHWNSIRYCIGFPPEMWYRIADEEGLLIQDEFPIWFGGDAWPAELKADEIAREYKEWIEERWNHACVVIWDGQNETVTPETGKAIAAVLERKADVGAGKVDTPTIVLTASAGTTIVYRRCAGNLDSKDPDSNIFGRSATRGRSRHLWRSRHGYGVCRSLRNAICVSTCS